MVIEDIEQLVQESGRYFSELLYKGREFALWVNKTTNLIL